MLKKSFLLLFFLGIASIASAVTTVQDGWLGPSGGGVSQDWFTGSNWDKGVAPFIQDYPTSGNYGVTTYKGTSGTNYDTDLATCPVITDGDAAAIEIRVGGGLGVTEIAYLVMESGTLATQNFLGLGIHTTAGDRSGVFYMHGGDITLGGAANGVRTSGHLYVGNDTSDSSYFGKLYMDGGTIDVGATFYIANGVGGGEAYLSGDALITANSLSMRPNASNVNTPKLSIADNARVIINGDITGTLSGYFANGWITGATYDYNITTPGKTTIYVPEPATICLLGLGALSLIRRK
jgi:hypothetical protein